MSNRWCLESQVMPRLAAYAMVAAIREELAEECLTCKAARALEVQGQPELDEKREAVD